MHYRTRLGTLLEVPLLALGLLIQGHVRAVPLLSCPPLPPVETGLRMGWADSRPFQRLAPFCI